MRVSRHWQKINQSRDTEKLFIIQEKKKFDFNEKFDRERPLSKPINIDFPFSVLMGIWINSKFSSKNLFDGFWRICPGLFKIRSKDISLVPFFLKIWCLNCKNNAQNLSPTDFTLSNKFTFEFCFRNFS